MEDTLRVVTLLRLAQVVIVLILVLIEDTLRAGITSLPDNLTVS